MHGRAERNVLVLRTISDRVTQAGDWLRIIGTVGAPGAKPGRRGRASLVGHFDAEQAAEMLEAGDPPARGFVTAGERLLARVMLR